MVVWPPRAEVRVRDTAKALLDAVADDADRVPCVVAGGDAWLSDDKFTRSVAVEACRACVALDSCRADAERYPPEFGVFGAKDWTAYGERLAADRERKRLLRADPEWRDDPDRRAADAEYQRQRYVEQRSDPWKVADMRERDREAKKRRRDTPEGRAAYNEYMRQYRARKREAS